jgi:hypothetical protein
MLLYFFRSGRTFVALFASAAAHARSLSTNPRRWQHQRLLAPGDATSTPHSSILNGALDARSIHDQQRLGLVLKRPADALRSHTVAKRLGVDEDHRVELRP